MAAPGLQKRILNLCADSSQPSLLPRPEHVFSLRELWWEGGGFFELAWSFARVFSGPLQNARGSNFFALRDGFFANSKFLEKRSFFETCILAEARVLILRFAKNCVQCISGAGPSASCVFCVIVYILGGFFLFCGLGAVRVYISFLKLYGSTTVRWMPECSYLSLRSGSARLANQIT